MVMFHRGCIEQCTTNQLAHIAAHEISHLIAHFREFRSFTEEERFDREYEADYLGMMMMAKAGYYPRGAIEWLERSIKKKTYREKIFRVKPILPGQRTHPPVSPIPPFCIAHDGLQILA